METRFEYDQQKSASNKSKHGIDFVEAQMLWLRWFHEEAAHLTGGEMRYKNIGKIGERYWTAIVSYRGSIRRIISVYPSNPIQIEIYERYRKARG